MNEKKRNERKIDLELPDITFRAKKNERKFIMNFKVETVKWGFFPLGVCPGAM